MRNGKNLMKYRKKASLICLAMFILMLGGSGCMKRSSSKDKMIAYMNEKYDDHFEYVAPFGGEPGATSKQILVKSEKFPDSQIWVQYIERDGEELFYDNYNEYRYESLVRERLFSLLKDAFGCEVKLAYSVATKGTKNSFTSETTFDEYINATRIGFQAIILLHEKVNEYELENNLKTAIRNSNLTVFGSIYFTSDEHSFELAFNQPHKDLDLMRQLQFSMDAPDSFRRLEWRPGNVE